MEKKIKLFVVSDVHGHTTELKDALVAAGFNADDPDHLFVGCGDYFDRGVENVAMLEFLTSLQNKVLVRGNHESLLLRVLDEGCIDYTDVHNGTDITVEEFFGRGSIDSRGHVKKKIATEIRLRRFIYSTIDYFETENFVFVHGWIPTAQVTENALWADNWRLAPFKEWEWSRYSEWQKKYRNGRPLPDKTLVCGHRTSAYGFLFDGARSPSDRSPFFGDGMIAIDAGTYDSGRVNVLVIEDTLKKAETYRMKLDSERFLALQAGTKTADAHLMSDEYRNISAGDTVIFYCDEKPDEKITARVGSVALYKDFLSVTDDFELWRLGYSGMLKGQYANMMTAHCGETQIAENGVLTVSISPL